MVRTLALRRIQILILLACGPMLAAVAQEPKSPPMDSLFERYPEATKLYQAKQYAEAAAILEPFYVAGPDGFGWYWNSAMYDLACYEAQAGRKQKALEVLVAWQARGGSVSAKDLAKDADLASLHDDPRFTQIVQTVRTQERLWAHEPAQNVPFAPTLSEDARIAGLSAVWAEARLNFAFFDRRPDLDWNQTYVDFLSKVRATPSTEDYYRVLMRFAALLKDGHTNVYPPEVLQKAFYARPGLHTRLVENTVVVTGIDDPALVTQSWRVGDVLLKIDGEDIHRYAEREIAPIQSSSTPQDLEVRTYAYALLSGRAGSSFHVIVRDREGKEVERVLTRLRLEEQAKLKKAPNASVNMRSDGIAVLTIDEFEDTEGTKALLANLPLVTSSKGLIIDVRANGAAVRPWICCGCWHEGQFTVPWCGREAISLPTGQRVCCPAGSTFLRLRFRRMRNTRSTCPLPC
jgi:hypothetical protein